MKRCVQWLVGSAALLGLLIIGLYHLSQLDSPFARLLVPSIVISVGLGVAFAVPLYFYMKYVAACEARAKQNPSKEKSRVNPP